MSTTQEHELPASAARAPEVSVVVTAYNRARLLKRAVESVLDQTWQAFELIIVDDASTDDTERVAKSIPDARLRYIRHERNMGAAAAYNSGIRAARAPLIAFLDSDDTARPIWLERMVAACAAHPGIGMVWGWIAVHSDKNPDGAIMYRTPWKSGPRILVPTMLNWTPGSGTVMIRREAFDEVGLLDPAVGQMFDVDWALRFAVSGQFDVDIIPEVLMDIHHHGENMSSRINEQYLAYLRYHVKKHEAVLARYPCAYAGYLYQLGRVSEALGHSDEAGRFLKEAIRLCPRQLRFRVYPLVRDMGMIGAWNRLAQLRTDLRGQYRAMRHRH